MRGISASPHTCRQSRERAAAAAVAPQQRCLDGVLCTQWQLVSGLDRCILSLQLDARHAAMLEYMIWHDLRTPSPLAAVLRSQQALTEQFLSICSSNHRASTRFVWQHLQLRDVDGDAAAAVCGVGRQAQVQVDDVDGAVGDGGAAAAAAATAAAGGCRA